MMVSQSKYLDNFKLDSVVNGFSLPPSNNVSHINVVDSSIYIGTSKGLGKSVDGGRSWVSFRTNPAFANDGIFAIASNGDTIWTSTGYEKELNEGSVQTGSGYAYSVDGGMNWQHVNQTIDSRGDSIISYGINDSLWILPVVVPEQNVTFDISFSPGTVWIASWASGLRKSTDSGQHWQRVLLPPDNASTLKPTDTLWSYTRSDSFRQHRIFQRFDPRQNNNFLAFAVYAVNNDTIWCGTAGGVNRSIDGGQSWVKFNHQNQSSPILGNWVIAIKEQRFQGFRRLWITNWRASDNREEFGVSYTDDDGKAWTNLLHGVKAYDFAFMDSVAYIATDDGVFRTPDGGRNLVKVSNIIDPSVHGIITTPQVFTVAVMGDTIIVGTSDGMASTIDNTTHPFGSSWRVYRRTYEELGTNHATYAYPNPFSPNFGPTRIHYGAKSFDPSTPDRTVHIQIFDYGMNRVRTLINATRSSTMELDELWDGRNDEGRIVANGVYFYRLNIDSDEPLFGKILILQ
ncbi:MAG: hypothetical protein HYR76_03015 [Ignavibacteria bacterium]|nr:hypothetical protein [Ignavibacteria bacterium]